jgi:hypothetical protein
MDTEQAFPVIRQTVLDTTDPRSRRLSAGQTCGNISRRWVDASAWRPRRLALEVQLLQLAERLLVLLQR